MEPSSSETLVLDKCKRKEFTAGPSKKTKKKAGGTSSAYLPSSSVNAELWKPKFFTIELGKQVIVANSAKDHDTSLALVRAVMLPKVVVDLS